MKAMPKTNECIKIIKHINEITLIFHNEEIKEDLFNKFPNNYKEKFDNIVRFVEEIKVINTFRFFPIQSITCCGESSFKKHTEGLKTNTMAFIEKHIPGFTPDVVWNALSGYDEVSLSDLEIEFEEMLPDPNQESINNCYKLIKRKFGDILNVSDPEYYNYFDIIKDPDIMPYFESVVRLGIASEKDVDRLLFTVGDIIKWLYIKTQQIIDLYKSFKNEPQQEINNVLPSELTTDEAKAIFKRGVENGLFKETTVGYKRDCTRQLLAYFAQQMSLKFELSNKQDKDGNITINWKIFESLFKEDDLKRAKNDWMKVNSKFTPNGFEKIDQIIEPT